VEYHVNGELVAREEATVSVDDRGFRYGDGVFETMRAYGGEVLDWGRHVDRLRRGCERLGMAGAIPDDLAARVAETLDANDLADAYVRVNLTRGVQPGKLTPRPDPDPTVVIVVRELPRGGRDGEPVWDGPATVQTVATQRVPDASIPADVKTHNYLSGILARLELRRASGPDHRPDEALVRDTGGNLASGSTSNVFFVDDGTLKTPAEGQILPGITREVVLELAADEEFPVETGRYGVNDVREADEAFLTNRTWEVRPVGTVDGLTVGGGPITALLARLYDERVERLCYRRG